MEHTEDDTHLHLNSIGEGELVFFGDGPARVLAEGISASVVDVGVGEGIGLSFSRVVPLGITGSSGLDSIGASCLVSVDGTTKELGVVEVVAGTEDVEGDTEPLVVDCTTIE